MNSENAKTGTPGECLVRLVRLVWSEHQPRWWVIKRDGQPVAALAFETSEKNQRRSWSDQSNYVVGSWNSWIKTDDGQQRLTWPEETPVAEMLAAIEAADIRLK